MTAPGEIVRATGLCVACDFKFINEVIARYPDGAMPGGWATWSSGTSMLRRLRPFIALLSIHSRRADSRARQQSE
jgi:hypothetical protein